MEDVKTSEGTQATEQSTSEVDLKQSGFDEALKNDAPVEPHDTEEVAEATPDVIKKPDPDDAEPDDSAADDGKSEKGQPAETVEPKQEAAPEAQKTPAIKEDVKKEETTAPKTQETPPETLEDYLMKDEAYKELAENYNDVYPLVQKPMKAMEYAFNQMAARVNQLEAQLGLVMPLHQERETAQLISHIRAVHQDFDHENPYDGKLKEWIASIPEGSADQRYVKEVLTGSNPGDINRLLTRFKLETGYQAPDTQNGNTEGAVKDTGGLAPEIQQKLNAMKPVQSRNKPVGLSGPGEGTKEEGFNEALKNR